MAYVDRNYFEDSRILRLRACLGRGAELLPLRLFLRFPHGLEAFSPTETEALAGWWGEPGRMAAEFESAGIFQPIKGSTNGTKRYEWAEDLPFDDGEAENSEKEKEKAAKKKKEKDILSVSCVSIRKDEESETLNTHTPTHTPFSPPGELAGHTDTQPDTGFVALAEIHELLLAFADIKDIRFATMPEQQNYLKNSPFFYAAKRLITACGGLENAKAIIARYAEENGGNGQAWDLETVLKQYWQNKAAGTPPQERKPDNYRRCECGTLLGGATIRVETDRDTVDAAIVARCPKCGKIYGISLLEGFAELGVSRSEFGVILSRSRMESFTATEWAEWTRKVRPGLGG